MRKLILTALVFTLLHAGEYADAFLQTSVPAASMGMGRVVLTPLVGLASVAGNPAGLAQSENREYLFQYADLFGMAFHTGAGISFPLSRNRQLAECRDRIRTTQLNGLYITEMNQYLRLTSTHITPDCDSVFGLVQNDSCFH